MLEKCLREYQKVSGKLPKIQTCYLNFKHLVSLEKVPAMNSDDQSIQPIKTWCSKAGKTSASCLARCDCLFLIGWGSSSKLSYTSHWSQDCFYAHAIKFVFFVLSKIGKPCQWIYNTRHKSLKQTPFLSNFLEQSWDFYFTLFSPLKCAFSLPNVEPRVFWSTETTVIPKSTLGKGK